MFRREKGSPAPAPVVPPRPSKEVCKGAVKVISGSHVLVLLTEAVCYHQDLDNPVTHGRNRPDEDSQVSVHAVTPSKQKLLPCLLTVIISRRRTTARSRVSSTLRPRYKWELRLFNPLHHCDTLDQINLARTAESSGPWKQKTELKKTTLETFRLEKNCIGTKASERTLKLSEQKKNCSETC